MHKTKSDLVPDQKAVTKFKSMDSEVARSRVCVVCWLLPRLPKFEVLKTSGSETVRI
jgi:hypothetical protein